MIIGIVGLGLMGGSFGKALRKHKLAKQIIGYDHNISHQKEAISLNLVDKIVDLEELRNADMIVLCIPVDAIVKFLPSLISCKDKTTIIDFGGTKELIVKSIPNEIKSNFIPAHPMTGTEKFGPSAAIDDLYENKIMVLCDIDKCDETHKNKTIKLFENIKMNLVFMESKDHDIHASYISHLPHVISYALANTVMDEEKKDNILTLAAGGFRDMSRIAKSSPDMWTDVFKQNKKNLLESIEKYENQMKMAKKMIEDDNYDDLKHWMTKANALHDIL